MGQPGHMGHTPNGTPTSRARRRAAERRARRQAADELVHAFAEQHQCPDCSADTRLTEQAPGVFALLVAHDNTCPAYRAMPLRGTS